MNTSTNAGSHFRGTPIGGVPMPRKGGSAPKGNSPKTAAKPQSKPVANVKTNQSHTSADAERQIKRPPQPFQTKNSALYLPVTTTHDEGVGDGKSKNVNGLKKSAPQSNISATGNSVPGGYSKVVGGQKGGSHPAKKTDTAASLGVKSKRNAAFYGGAR